MFLFISCGTDRLDITYETDKTDDIDNNIIVDEDANETDEEETKTDIDSTNITDDINDEEIEDVDPDGVDDFVSDDELSDNNIIDEDEIIEEPDEVVSLCGNGKIDEGEFCDKGEIKSPCVNANADIFESGNIICNDTCTGWTYKKCVMKYDDIIRLDTPEVLSGYDEMYYQPVHIPDNEYHNVLMVTVQTNSDEMCRKYSHTKNSYSSKFLNTKFALLYDDEKLKHKGLCKIGTILDGIQDRSYEELGWDIFREECSYVDEPTKNVLDMFPEKFQSYSYWMTGYEIVIPDAPSGYGHGAILLRKNGLSTTQYNSPDNYLLCSIGFDIN
jgi:hypothetical protein